MATFTATNFSNSKPSANGKGHAKGPGPRPVFEYQPGWQDRIPEELRERDQSVLWRYEPNEAGDKWTKVPYRCTARPFRASTTDPQDWDSFPTAEKVLLNSQGKAFQFDGFGFVFSITDPYVGFDLDNCLVNGELAEWAREILDQIGATYLEYSPSGNGIKGICRGKLPGSGMRRIGLGPDGTGALEMYDRARFFTLTGDLFHDEWTTIEDCSEAITALYLEFKPPAKERVEGETGEPNGTVEDLIDRARRAKNGEGFISLFDKGEIPPRCSPSEADFRLCCRLAFWLNGNVKAMDQAFRSSKLFREKWDRPWGDSTYGAETIANALSVTEDFYRPPAPEKEEAKAEPTGPPKFEAKPRPLTADLLKIEAFPLELIPERLRRWIQDIAHRGCFPIETPVAAMIVAISILIGRTLTIRPKRHDTWTVYPNLWGAIVGHPGIQKSPPVKETLLPLRRLVAEAHEAFEAAAKKATEFAQIAEARAAAAKKKLTKAANDGASDEELQAIIAEKDASGPGGAPVCKRYEANDATIEKFADLLRENPRGLLQFRDELTGFLRSMDRQGHENDRAFYLEGWSGDGSSWVDRIGRGTTFVKHLCISIFGTIQPGPLAKYLKGTISGEDADGFMPRFQILMYPDPIEKFVNVDQWPDKEAKNEAFDVFRWIDCLKPDQMGAELDEESETCFLRFAPDAQPLFDEWREDLENRLRGNSESAMMAAHLAKYRSLMPSLALILHVIDSYESNHLNPVSYQAAAAAAAWCDVLESHARRVYQGAADGDPELAARLGERIKASLPNPFTFRQVANKGWSGLDNVEDVRKAVGILEDRGWAKVVVTPPGPKGGRPSEEVWINPAVHGSNGEVS